MKLLATLMLALLGLVSTPAVAAEPVYVIRHLEKAVGQDPPLTPQGAARADRLADLLENKGIAAIFATPTRRAMETAEPLAKRLGLAITAYDPLTPLALVGAVTAAQGPVLIVGHSNTVSDLVGRFGGTPPPPLSDEDYGTIFIVEADGEVATIELN